MYVEPVDTLEHCYFRMLVIRGCEEKIRNPEYRAAMGRTAVNHLEERIIALKRSVRNYFRRHHHSMQDDPRIVRDDGIDGCIVIVPLPTRITDPETAQEWFEEHEYMQIRPSMYDCTGQLFTSWFKIVCRHGRYYAYHSICCDV